MTKIIIIKAYEKYFCLINKTNMRLSLWNKNKSLRDLVNIYTIICFTIIIAIWIVTHSKSNINLKMKVDGTGAELSIDKH